MSDVDDTQLNTVEQPYPTQVLVDDATHGEDDEDVSPDELAEADDAQAPEDDPTEVDDPNRDQEGFTEEQAEDAQVDAGLSQHDEDDARSARDDAAEQEEQVEERSNGINFAAANGDFDDDSELSDLDEEQFKDFDDIAPDGEEPAVYNLPSFRKKKGAAEKKVKKSKQRVRRGSESSDDAGKIYSDDEDRPKRGSSTKSKVPERPTDMEELRKWKLDRQMDAAIAPQRKRKKKDEDDLIASMDDEIIQLAEKMRLAALADAEANAEKRIATKKLKLLPEVQRILRSQALYDSILDNNMLVSMKHWLEPLPDKSLPALNIQKTIFDALQALPIKTEHLRESGVGKVVLFYKKSKKPEDFIKNQANTLVSEWSRPIIRKSASHKTKRVKTVDYDGPTSIPRLHNTPSQPEMSGTNQYKSKGGTSIPRGEKAYDIAPRARELAAIQTVRDGGEAYKRIKNTLKDLGKKTGKKGGVSIEGRGIA